MPLNTYSEEFKRECLARWVLQIGRGDSDGGLRRRQAWLSDFERRHGVAVADKLKAEIMKQHDNHSRKE